MLNFNAVTQVAELNFRNKLNILKLIGQIS